MASSLQMQVARAGETEDGKVVPVGTLVEYRGHVLGGMVCVRFEDGTEAVMHPACFDELSTRGAK